MNNNDEVRFGYMVGCIVGSLATCIVFLWASQQPVEDTTVVRPCPPQLEVTQD